MLGLPRLAPVVLLAALTCGPSILHAARPSANSTFGAAETAEPGNDAIQRAVVDELQHDARLRRAAIRVAAREGIVVLTGSVPVQAWRQRAQRVARVVRGVRAVVDRIVVVPMTRPDAEVAREIRRAIRATAALARLPIVVSVAGGVAELRGGISSWEQQQLAQMVAAGVPGVRFCHNLLSVSGRLGRHGWILAADVRSRLAWDPLVARDPIDVSATGTRVRLSGKVGSAAELRRASSLAWVKGVSDVDVTGLIVDEANRPNPNVRLRGLTDQEIVAAIGDLRPEWPSIAAAEVEVSVLQGVVSLRGSVKTLAQSQAMEALAKSVVSVVSVQNQLRGPWWRPPQPAPPTRQRARPRGRSRR